MPKRKASFYGVRVGNQPGVYDDWEVCKLQVLGFRGSQYKGFATRAEAENYVNGFDAGYHSIAAPKTETTQSQANTKLDERFKQYALPIATSKRNTKKPILQRVTAAKEVTPPLYPSIRVTTSKEEVISPSVALTTVTVLREEVTSSEELSAKDPSNCFKVIEENGQRFVIFESIKKFDSYFEGLCNTRRVGRSWNLKISCENQESRSQETSDSSSQGLQTQATLEDDEFVYFKDEDELKRYLEPYFKNAKENPPGSAQVYQSFDAVMRAPFYAQQDLAESLQLNSNLNAAQGTFSIPHQEIYQIEFDGASKGNPGRAGAGALIRCPHGSVVLEMTESLGSETNNVAEYRALILGLKAALSKGMRKVRVQGDSKLVCLQVTGVWKVENKKLISLHKEVKRLEEEFEEFSISHIRREYNSAADALANEAVYLKEPAREVVKPIPACCL